jgi:RNA recognition motif-containing protein
MNIYVGNLSYEATEEELRSTFSRFGNVTDVRVIRDKITGKPRGFAFVTMETKEQGDEAIKNLNGQAIMGRPVKLNEARAREERPFGRRDG